MQVTKLEIGSGNWLIFERKKSVLDNFLAAEDIFEPIL
jgi:hypothetical protein